MKHPTGIWMRRGRIGIIRRAVLLMIGGFMSVASWTQPIKYIDYHFENGSPLYYDILEDGSALVSLVYDHERNSPNRANGHWYFQVFSDQGTSVKLLLQNFHNVWNGKPATPAKDNTACFWSIDGTKWAFVKTSKTPENRLAIQLTMPADSIYLARLEPYTVTDLAGLLSEIRDDPLIKITEIGKTVENRPLEIIRVGHANAPHRIFIRGRAHAWEPGGNWVIEGIIRNLLKSDKTNQYLDRYSVYILPMANKDGVAGGRTRFNMRGKDLNRNWDQKANPYLAPENAALENWLEMQIELGFKPDLAIDFHNDDGGNLHISRPNINLESYLSNMSKLDSLLRVHTWYTEGSTGSNFRNPGSIGEGLLERYGIDALVYELNANWIAGLHKVPFGDDWMLLGEQLCEVFYQYFDD